MDKNKKSEVVEAKSTNKELFIGIAVVAGILLLIAIVALIVYYNTPKVVYQPAKACDLFTKSEAQELLGKNVINASDTEPEITKDTAVSKCGYTDMNSNQDEMKVAAVVVRAGINDTGVEQNKTEFAAGKPKENTETIKDLGDAAYYNHDLNLLNVLDGYNWLLISYGTGSTPEANTVDQAVVLARKVVQ